MEVDQLHNSSNGYSHSINNKTEENLINKKEFVRVLMQALDELGFKKSRNLLEQESGMKLQSEEVSELCDGILSGNWPLVETRLSALIFVGQEEESTAKFLIYEQKFLELLEKGDTKAALDCLRNQLTPLHHDQQRLHKLSSFLMCTSSEELSLRAQWDGSKGRSRAILLRAIKECISPEVLMAESRLSNLILQGIQLQKQNCLYHNTMEEQVSLYHDHHCQRSQLPSHTQWILEEHVDEVWHIKFSHNGKYLASASKDTTAVIWDMNTDKGGAPTVAQVLRGHLAAISFLAWSPDDSSILTCGNDNYVKLWDVESGTCLRTFTKHSDSVTSCAWFPDGKHFVSGGLDRNIFMLDLEGNEIRTWNCARINDLTITHDGKWLVVICQEKKIRLYDIEKRVEDFIQETESITSLDLSADSKYLLVNISSHEIHVWDLETKKLVQKYRGQKQSRFVIRSCFGGAKQAFVISGSEDSQVYIWHRYHGTLLDVLSGHSGTVNAVSWNPVNPYMFASCSDDHTIRIWTRVNEEK